MEEFGWFDHHQQEIEESIIFCSDNIFSNPILDLPNPDYVTSSFGSASQYWRQTIAANSLHEGKNVTPLVATVKNLRSVATDTDNNTSQYSHQTTAVNSLHKGKNVIPLTNTITKHSGSATTECEVYSLPDYQDDISVIFSNYQNLCNNTMKNQSDVVSSDTSVTKQTDDVISSQCSSDKTPNYSSMFYSDNHQRSKKPRLDPIQSTSSTINFRQTTDSGETIKEMVYRAAAFRPVSFSDEEVVEKPQRKNVRISSDPQTAAARRRREKISERIRVLQKLVPGGSKMDTASMLDEAANYLKFLRSQVKAFEQKFDYRMCGTSSNAHSTSQIAIHNNVALGLPLPMQAPFLLPYQQIYPSL